MHVSKIAAGGAALLGFSIGTALCAGRPALAVIADKAKSFACSASGACLSATNSGSGNGLAATSTSLNGVQGNSNSAVASGVYGESDSSSGGVGVAGRTYGSSTHSQGVLADGGPSGGLPLEITGGNSYFGDMLDAVTNGTVVAALYRNGDLILHGRVYTSGSCQVGCAHTKRSVVTFESAASQPTLEDTGEARLSGGAVSVPLDPAFANVIDPRAGYFVLLTPEGDTKGLYVARRSPGGFEVRETGGGRSSIGFAYRIVAHPYGAPHLRLPAVTSTDGLRRLTTSGTH